VEVSWLGFPARPWFTTFNFVKYVESIDVNGNTNAAIVRFLDKDYFPSQDLLLLPYSKQRNDFRARPDEMLSVLTFDASKIGDAYAVDLKSEWPKNILAAAGITPSIEKARQWTGLGC
jgi:hypothetical protein